MNYIDCEVVDCAYQLDNQCECTHVNIDKFGKCKSYLEIEEFVKE
jgi:hypothetical protein